MTLGFDTAVEFVLQNEGGYVNRKNDRGGPTNMGITIPTLTKYLKRIATIDDVSNLSILMAKDIYKAFFWDALHCDSLPYVIATAMFDTAVNRGQAISVGFAQRCVNVNADGILGQETIHALSSTDQYMFIYNYVGALQDSYAEICIHVPSDLEFLEGWLRRSRRLFLLEIN